MATRQRPAARGRQANIAVYHALLQPGDTVLGLELAHGGHLTHGMKLNVSAGSTTSRLLRSPRGPIRSTWTRWPASPGSQPKLIVAGSAGLSAALDFASSARSPTRVGRLPVRRHGALRRLVAAGLHPSPVPCRLRHDDDPQDDRRRARRDDRLQRGHAKKIDSAVFPGQQGGPLDARDRRQGGRAGNRSPLPSAITSSAARRLAGASPRSCSTPGTASGSDRRHRRAPRTSSTSATLELDGHSRRTVWTDRDHGEPRFGPVRPAAADGLRRRASRTPALATRPRRGGLPELGVISRRRCGPTSSRARASSPSAPRRSPRSTLPASLARRGLTPALPGAQAPRVA